MHDGAQKTVNPCAILDPVVIRQSIESQTMLSLSKSTMPELRLSKDNEVTAASLSRFMLFRGESTETLEWLLGLCPVKTLLAGETLLSPEQENDTLFLILAGRVLVQFKSKDCQAFAYLDAGNCVGEMSIIDNHAPSAKIVTHTECKLLAIKDGVLWSMINRSPSVSRNLLYILSTRVRQDNHLILESLQQQHIYEQNSKVDILTGLHNRRWLDEMLNRLIERSTINGEPLSLLMLDVDRFKNYNDMLGHQAGDCALNIIANTLLNNLRPSDSAARYGGEEFIVIMPETTMAEAHMVAERLRKAVSEQGITRGNGIPLPHVTISIGLACIDSNQDSEELIAAADSALYRAKNAGRNQVSD